MFADEHGENMDTLQYSFVPPSFSASPVREHPHLLWQYYLPALIYLDSNIDTVII